MNIFEDLIEELKEDNLLEETVTEINKRNNATNNLILQKKEQDDLPGFSNNTFEKKNFESEFPSKISAPRQPGSLDPNGKAQQSEPTPSEQMPRAAEFSSLGKTSEINQAAKKFENNLKPKDFADEEAVSGSEQHINQADFYKKRASDEVTSLQMVEHVLSGVERDFLHVQPKIYDDLEVKKSLHNFLQNSQNIDSPEQANAEFLLMQATESWYSALSQKDKNISVNYLRRYCETTKPALSAQALAALARFYRNAPFSDFVRGKFDLVITRYFARESGGDIRILSLSRDEIIEKLNEFYAEWSSIPLYATEDDASRINLAAAKFGEFITEAEESENFEDLIKNDFFKRLKDFKESTHENFFAPRITAASIESNIRIGNRYLELLLKAKENSDAEKLEEQYGNYQNQVISDVICKTLQITKVFEGKFADADIVREVSPSSSTEAIQAPRQIEFERQNLNAARSKPAKAKTNSNSKNNTRKVNKGLVIATILVVLCSLGLYIYIEYLNPPPPPSPSIKAVNLDNSSLSEFIETARLNGEMFYGLVNANWDQLSNEKKEEFLRKVLVTGKEKSYSTVSLIDSQGRSVGFASADKVEVYNP